MAVGAAAGAPRGSAGAVCAPGHALAPKLQAAKEQLEDDFQAMEWAWNQ